MEKMKLYVKENTDSELIEVDHYINSHTKLVFKCRCGNLFERSWNNFKSGQTICNSCSKKQSKGEKEIIKSLSKYGIKFKYQMKYEKLLGLGGRKLSYDFYIPEQNILIEYQGEYHDGKIDFQTEEQFKIQKEHDRRKREYAKQNDIDLLEIWYWDFDNIESILKNVLNT